jgi:hypothetical protein
MENTTPTPTSPPRVTWLDLVVNWVLLVSTIVYGVSAIVLVAHGDMRGIVDGLVAAFCWIALQLSPTHLFTRSRR